MDHELAQKIKEAKEAHRKSAQAKEELHQHFGGRYIKDVVYSANDGIITTFAIVAGVAGAGLFSNIVLILGFANLVGDGLSMAIGNYLGSKSEKEYENSERRMEEWEVKHIPEEERFEIRDIYTKKGFSGETLDEIVRVITSDKKLWVREMMIHELGILQDDSITPFKHGLVTFASFVFAGFLPLLPYMFKFSSAWYLSILMTGVGMFVVGASRTLVTREKWYWGGLEMFCVGAIAAVAAYSIGWGVERFVM